MEKEHGEDHVPQQALPSRREELLDGNEQTRRSNPPRVQRSQDVSTQQKQEHYTGDAA